MSVYDEVEREAREDHRAWLADEWEDDRPTAGELAAWEALEPTVCPVCDGDLTIDPADPSVGIMTEVRFCENDLPDGTPCLWPPQE